MTDAETLAARKNPRPGDVWDAGGERLQVLEPRPDISGIGVFAATPGEYTGCSRVMGSEVWYDWTATATLVARGPA